MFVSYLVLFCVFPQDNKQQKFVEVTIPLKDETWRKYNENSLTQLND